MKSFPTDRIRNVALVGHGGAGKTSLAEALLARAGAIARAGKVDDGTSLLDTEPESIKRKISLSLALAPFEWKASDGDIYKVNIIDTPGYVDFEAEVDAALAVADLAVFVVSAVDGVEVQTELLWRKAAALGIPRMFFVNKEDKDRADFHAVLDQLKAAFGTGVTPLELPLGEAGTLHGVADVLTEEALEYEKDGKHRNEPLPADVTDEEHGLHDALLEEIVSGDDAQLERYLSGDMPSVAELERTLAHEVLDCLEFPVMLGSAATGVGIDRFADYLCELGPSPADRPVTVIAGNTTSSVVPNAAGQPLLQVFKTIADPYVGQLSVFKVLSGTIKADDKLLNSSNGGEERMHAMFLVRGKEQIAVGEVAAGDIAAVAKLNNTHTGDTLAPKGTPVKVQQAERHVPQYAVAIVPRTQADDDKLGNALLRLQTEDAALLVERLEETNQTVMRGLGDTHIAVTIERLARKFGVNVDTAEVRVAYRETINDKAQAEGKVKKQSGGHGQYAVVNLRVAPLPRGAGFKFVDAIVGGAVPRNYIPAVQTGIEDTMAKGGVHGFSVVDVQVDFFDGKFHAVDSSEMAFKTAAAHGFKEALAAAGVVVLEPVSLLTVTVPPKYQGDVMGDITARRGRVQGSDNGQHGDQQISALVPAAELLRYAIELRSMTGGRGRFSVQHDHYDVLPPHLVDKAKASLPKH
ncbi:MAG: elongation factor G [Actinomycetota bacterium]|nr:elongation factor G [Actinomycetota bacterium]